MSLDHVKGDKFQIPLLFFPEEAKMYRMRHNFLTHYNSAHSKKQTKKETNKIPTSSSVHFRALLLKRP